MLRGRVVDYLVYCVVRLVIGVVQAVPIDSGAQFARQFAWVFSNVLKIRQKVVHENLRQAFPDTSELQLRQLTFRMWEHIFLLVLEVAHAPRKIHETNWRRYVRVNNGQALVRQLLSDRATIVVTGHYGNFEVGGYTLGVLGFPTHTVARTLDNPYLNRYVNQFRGATGQYMIPKVGGYDQILEVLGQGGAMTLLADQAAGPKGCWVDFFNRPASTYKAIGLFSLSHDAPLVVTYVRRLDRPLHFEMGISEVADPRDTDNSLSSVPALTQWYTSQLENFIRQTPEQYWWVHRRWKGAENRRRKPKQAA